MGALGPRLRLADEAPEDPRHLEAEERQAPRPGDRARCEALPRAGHAEEQEGAPEEAVSEIRRRVLEESAPLPALSRKYREIVFPLDDDERRDKDAAALRAAARRLHDLLDGTDAVPKRLAGEVRAAVTKLVEALDPGSDEAAA